MSSFTKEQLKELNELIETKLLKLKVADKAKTQVEIHKDIDQIIERIATRQVERKKKS